MMQNFEAIDRAGKGNIDVAVKAFDAISRTTKEIVAEMADYSTSSYEQSSKVMEQLMGAKSLGKAFEVQREYAKSVIEDFTARMGKFGAFYADLGKEVFKQVQK